MAADTHPALHAAGVYRRSIGAYLRSIAEYPADFWVMALSGTSWQLMLFSFLSILFANVKAIAGWDYHQMLVLAGFLAVSWGSTALLWDGIWDTGKLIVEGDMDYRITRPAPVLIQVGSKHVGMQVFGDVTLGLVMMTVGWIGAGISAAAIPLALFLLLCAAIIQASLLTIANAMNFWVKGRTPVVAFMLAELQNEAMRYPLTVFPAAVRFVFTFGLPLAFASFIPVQILTGKLDPWWLLATPVAAAVTAFLAVLTFRAGLKVYDSAGH
jgi:ABC-2 type transport system permease protein